MARWPALARWLLLALACLLGPTVHAAPPRPAPAAPALQAAGSPDDLAEGVVARYLLMDQNGRAVSNQDFRGSFQLIAFGYTACPDVCPTTLAEMAAILQQLGPLEERLQPLFITVDPERDTPEHLKTYTAFFHPRILGLTGSPELIRRVAGLFKVRYEKVRDPGAPPEQYWMDHSAGMILLGPDGGYVTRFAYATPPAEIAARLRPLLEAAPPPRER
ncbi:MAG: SCO family protein [Betaproteobacteria bacterium]|nr:SCO family protein [Betaproteobacteria bacterium]